MARLDEAIEAVANMPPLALRDAWREMFGEAAPALSPSLLRRALAHAVQERALGGLAAGKQKVLETIAASDGPIPDPSIKLKPGTRLVREWNGTVHNVLVTADGIVLGDQRYKSLSEVARVITGAHWSGPRFFGLKRPVSPPIRGIERG